MTTYRLAEVYNEILMGNEKWIDSCKFDCADSLSVILKGTKNIFGLHGQLFPKKSEYSLSLNFIHE